MIYKKYQQEIAEKFGFNLPDIEVIIAPNRKKHEEILGKRIYTKDTG